MTFSAILNEIEAGKFRPVYVLHGEESFYIDRIADSIMEKALTDAQRDFNQHIFYGRDADAQDIVNTARRYPVFADRQLVVLREAKDLRNLDPLAEYMKHPVPSTILVISHKNKSLDKRTSFYKSAKDQVVFESNRLKEDKLPDWIRRYVEDSGRPISDRAVFLIADHIGSDLSRMAGELDKLVINLEEGRKITEDDVERYIGISKEFNSFEFKDAFSEKNFAKAYRILQYFKKNPKAGPYVFILALLYNYFSVLYAMHQYKGLSSGEMAKTLGMSEWVLRGSMGGLRHYSLHKTEEVIGWLAEADMKMKGVNSGDMDSYDILMEVTYRIMH